MATFRSDLRIDPPFRDLRKLLREMDATLPRALNKVTKQGAQIVSDDARSRAAGLGPQQAAAARQIKPSGTAQGAAVTLARSSRVPYALAALLGMTRKTGWHLTGRGSTPIRPEYPGTPQHLPWIGTGWKVGDLTAGPRAINPAFAAKAPELIRFLESELTSFASKHFPDP